MSNIERLRLLGLPVFDDIDNLAELIHVSANRLEILTFRTSSFYKHYTISKRNGGTRDIYQPSRELKGVQAWILRNILDKLTPSDEATAFIYGRNIKHNVLPHAENRFFICIDIKDFFPSISYFRVYRIFKVIGYSETACVILANLCCCHDFLPQGGVTSPALSNLVAARLDRRLSGFCMKRNIVYTRYADDMTFSSNNRNLLNKSLSMFLEIIQDEGFEPNLKKLRVMGPKIHCRVTGLVKNSSAPQFGIGKKVKRKMRAIMYNMIRKGKIESKYKNIKSIEGWLSYLKSVDESSYEQMSKYWYNLRKNQ